MKTGGKKQRDGLTSIGRLMPEAYPSSEPDEVAALRAFAWWRHAVPERVARNALPVRLQRGVLQVHTTTSAWAQELSFLRDQIVAAIQTHAPHAGVQDMRVKVGPLPALPEHVREKPPEEPVIPLSAVPESIAASLAGVRDDSLRESIGKAARTVLAAQEQARTRSPKSVPKKR